MCNMHQRIEVEVEVDIEVGTDLVDATVRALQHAKADDLPFVPIPFQHIAVCPPKKSLPVLSMTQER